ncbi:hypothetical protein HRI_004921900 [Hibiscus trionum]|uniref:Uncharacterized protein n=1 Tax=Hibiscus trionum TaxID=183268 RepID=A0A9W7JG73_HIBTR|nr:hypothetical protein HRI_004921900 [Hibiscus trionum]
MVDLLIVFFSAGFVNRFLENWGLETYSRKSKMKRMPRHVVRLNDDIEDEGKRLKNLVRGIFAGNGIKCC